MIDVLRRGCEMHRGLRNLKENLRLLSFETSGGLWIISLPIILFRVVVIFYSIMP